MAAAAVFLLLAASDVLRWSADLDARGRGREEPATGERARVAELSLAGRLGLALRTPDESAALTWSPRALLREALQGAPAGTGNSTQHAGRLDLETRVAPTTRLGFRAGADWGLTDFSPLSAPPSPTGTGLLPSQQFVRTLALDAGVDLRHRLSRRLEVTAAAGVQRSGGLGHDAVQVLPIQLGASGAASLAWVADRDSTIALQATGSHARFSLGRSSQLSQVELGWGERPARHVRSDLSAGVALIRSEGDGGVSTHAYGSGAAGLRWDLPLSPTRGFSTTVHGRLSPAVDRLTGLAVQSLRADGAAELIEGPRRYGLSGSGGRALSGVSAGAEDLRLDAHVSWNLVRGVTAEAAFTAAWTNQLPLAGWQNQVYVGFRWSGAGAL